jgi:NitT/TauT family transport system ATP-binding protein
MDEPFQSLDLPLRIQLMDLTLSLLESEKRIAVAATHDPREAIYLAGRTVVIAGRPVRVVLDEGISLPQSERAYSSVAAAALEARIFSALVV